MKIVITGGTGFIGRRLALKLLEKNDLDFGRGQGADAEHRAVSSNSSSLRE